MMEVLDTIVSRGVTQWYLLTVYSNFRNAEHVVRQKMCSCARVLVCSCVDMDKVFSKIQHFHMECQSVGDICSCGNIEKPLGALSAVKDLTVVSTHWVFCNYCDVVERYQCVDEELAHHEWQEKNH